MKILVYNDDGETPLGFLSNVTINGDRAITSITGLGASSGTGAVTQGHGAPVSAPTNPTIPTDYTDLDTGNRYTWNVETQAWI